MAADKTPAGEKKEKNSAEAAAPVEKDTKKAAADAHRARAKKAAAEAAAASVKIAAAGETKTSPSTEPRLKIRYRQDVVPVLMKRYEFKNPMQVPRLKKVVINCCVKEAVANPKVLDGAFEEIMTISGQKPVLTRAKKSIASFKVREGNALGVKVTLRRARMYEFLDRLINVALPRVRDFKGVSPTGFDGRGNFSLGVREQIIFPEINYDRVDKVRGFTVSIETSAGQNEHAHALLAELGMPFRK